MLWKYIDEVTLLSLSFAIVPVLIKNFNAMHFGKIG